MQQYVDYNLNDRVLRFGDIISGFSHIVPQFEDFFNKKTEFILDIKQQKFFAVLTPCCSIEDKIIALAPLRELPFKLYLNPHFVEDFTRLNRLIPADKAHPPKALERMKPEEREGIFAQPPTYLFFEYYVYGPHKDLPTYTIRYKSSVQEDVCHYYIDFKELFTVSSNIIQRGHPFPKIAQLSIAARKELRDKIAYYFTRIPDEDIMA